MTVSWRRSASGAAAGVLLGVRRATGRARGPGGVAPVRLRLWVAGRGPVASRVVPHLPQNLAVDLRSYPQLGQARTSFVPHSSQKFIPSAFSTPQLGQCMLPLYSFGHPGARKTPAPSPSGRTPRLGQYGALLSPVCRSPAPRFGV